MGSRCESFCHQYTTLNKIKFISYNIYLNVYKPNVYISIEPCEKVVVSDVISPKPSNEQQLVSTSLFTMKMQMQIKDLQNERSHLLRELKQAAIRGSSRAVRFVGLSSEHIEKLRTYAVSLQQGEDFAALRTDNGTANQILQGLAHLTKSQQENSTSIYDLQNKFLSEFNCSSKHNKTP